MEKHSVVGVDIAKSVFDVAVSEEPGRVALRRRLSRGGFSVFFAQLPAATVVMEACGTAHYWARKLEEMGHRVVLLPPHQVRPYVTRNKTDRTDAKGILEAYRNADIRPVPIKTVAQQVLCSLHRFRSGWLASRTAQINTLRGLLRELGIAIPVGAEKVLPQVRALIADADSGIPDSLRPVLATACDEIEALGGNIKMTERQLEALAEQTPAVQRLESAPGIGLEDTFAVDPVPPSPSTRAAAPDATSLRPRQGPSAAFGGALCAALTRPTRRGLLHGRDEGPSLRRFDDTEETVRTSTRTEASVS